MQYGMTRPGVSGGETTILAVSPCEQDRWLITALASSQHITVLTASSLAEAVALCRRHAISLVVCERDLPDGDWREMLNQVNRLSPDTRVVVTSRLADEQLWAEVLNLGGYDVLAKPLSWREVAHVIESAVGAAAGSSLALAAGR